MFAVAMIISTAHREGLSLICLLVVFGSLLGNRQAAETH
jgi:hypothetical protein